MKPHHYRNNVSNTLIHSVVHTYNPDISEPIKAHNQDMEQTNNYFGMNHIDLYKDHKTNKTVFEVQPSQKWAPRVFPILPYCKGKLQFLKKFQF